MTHAFKKGILCMPPEPCSFEQHCALCIFHRVVSSHTFQAGIALISHIHSAVSPHCFVKRAVYVVCTCVYSRYITKRCYPCPKYVLLPFSGSDAGCFSRVLGKNDRLFRTNAMHASRTLLFRQTLCPHESCAIFQRIVS